MKISGYASRFDLRDAGGDRVSRGAFAASILSRSYPLPMLSDHQTPIGTWTRVFEDEQGLRVEGDVSDPALQRLIRDGRVTGLSIGFRTRRARDGPTLDARDLLEVDLHEVSIVAFPMLATARIDTVGPVQPETHTSTTGAMRDVQS